MSEIRTDSKSFATVFRANERRRERGVRAGVLEAAFRGAEIVADRISDDGLVDVGILKSSVHAVRAGLNAEVLVDAPHAAAIEVGARPHWMPIQPLIDWVMRHRDKFGLKRVRPPGMQTAANEGAQRRKDRKAAKYAAAVAEIMGIVMAIRAKIAEKGSPPHWFVKNSLPEMRRELKRIVEANVAKRVT